MKIVDFEKFGNVVKLYLAERINKDYWGDDWNDCPYEHNAGEIYERFYDKTVEVAITTNSYVVEPQDDYTYQGNTPFSKEMFKNRVAPFLVIGDEIWSEDYKWDFLYSQEKDFPKQNILVYYEDDLDDFLNKLKERDLLIGYKYIKKKDEE